MTLFTYSPGALLSLCTYHQGPGDGAARMCAKTPLLQKSLSFLVTFWHFAFACGLYPSPLSSLHAVVGAYD